MKNNQELKEYIQFMSDVSNGKWKAEFVFFWGGPYSQWAAAPFEYDCMTFLTAEHWMMWHKALTFGDAKRAMMIFDSHDPQFAKRIGREIENFDDAVWDKVKFEIVVLGNVLKFSQNPAFYEIMIDDYLADRILVEASPHDRIWGIGRSENDPDNKDVDHWDGQNLLGYAIMEARSRLRGFEGIIKA